MATLIIADSRGAGLQAMLGGEGLVGGVTILVHGGAGYELAALRSLPVIKKQNPQLIIIMTGICDLTWRNRKTKQTGLRHSTVDTNTNHVIQSANTALEIIRSAVVTKVSLATITGIDLADYNNPARKSMDTEQYRQHCMKAKQQHRDQMVLNMSILEINRRLIALNKSSATPTVWLGGVVHAYFGNKHHHYYIRLHDGCHPNDNTKRAWVRQISKYIKRISHTQTALTASATGKPSSK